MIREKNGLVGLKERRIWFVAGSQHLYGPEALKEVEANAQRVAQGIEEEGRDLPLAIEARPIVTTAEEVMALCRGANASEHCCGLIIWMHTFSPAKMWINGLKHLSKPFLHLHTQLHRDLPWATIDMDFMNLHQSAHGDREAAFLHTRLGLPRKIVVGHWTSPKVLARVESWMRAAYAWDDWQGAHIARIGDNMRNVAVTEGDKVAAEQQFGFAVNGWGVADLVEHVNGAEQAAVKELATAYEHEYDVAPPLRKGGDRHEALLYAARQELGLRSFLEERGAVGFTDTFEDLHGLDQLPGLSVQRLMAAGYGFGAEGDWKTAALLRAMKVMAMGVPGGTSFMEDYTYNLDPNNPLVLGAHMLEICPSIASGKPKIEIHPLGIGGKSDPVRMVFDAKSGPALNATLVDLGDRFRMIVNEVDAISPPEQLPQLPVARAVWRCRPDFETAVECWLRAGGAHHTGYSYAVTAEQLEDFAAMAGLEYLLIDGETTARGFRQELRPS